MQLTLFLHLGLGLILLVDTIRSIQPDVVVQIDSASVGRNLPFITPDFVAFQPGWLTSAVTSKTATQRLDIKKISLYGSIMDYLKSCENSKHFVFDI